jgi:hypothetical protein
MNDEIEGFGRKQLWGNRASVLVISWRDSGKLKKKKIFREELIAYFP